jgi:pSer/pThr/pTyr-binding forkhead associated (FHA) protein
MGTRRTWVLNCVGVSHELARDIIFIGRTQSNQVVIDHPTVSAQHALLLRVGESYRLKDLNSMNGTQINGVFVTESELNHGDTIQLGSVIAVVEEDCRKEWSSRFRDFLKSRKSATTARGRN